MPRITVSAADLTTITGTLPSKAEIEALRPLVDYRQVAVRDGTVFLRREGMELDLGGVGKQYAVDQVAARLREEGVESALVNLVGDVRTVGAAAGLDYLEGLPGTQGAIVTEEGDLLATEGVGRCSDLPGSLFERYPAL